MTIEEEKQKKQTYYKQYYEKNKQAIKEARARYYIENKDVMQKRNKEQHVKRYANEEFREKVKKYNLEKYYAKKIKKPLDN